MLTPLDQPTQNSGEPSKILTLNLAAMNMMAAQERVERKTVNRKHLYLVNRAQALSKMKDSLVRILHAVTPDFLISRLTKAMANDATPARPGRNFTRKQRPGVGVRYRPAYKRGR